MEDVVTLMAFSVLTTELPLSADPVALEGSLNITVAFHPDPEKLEDESVARAKYCTANVVVVFMDVAEHVLDAVNAVAK